MARKCNRVEFCWAGKIGQWGDSTDSGRRAIDAFRSEVKCSSLMNGGRLIE